MPAKKPAVKKGTKLKDIREVVEATEDSPENSPLKNEEPSEALTEEQILGLMWLTHHNYLAPDIFCRVTDLIIFPSFCL